ncbi:ammonium transporter [Aneurinibacillus danicus]|jgi:Amt family ammonium transporter|uniref:Ammonium transporter n=1 Tax=Aneurinibacillus danicus TaxID=267746 RepID=A0A511V949_9BACL|nr:ammonium transporter [Aneurinibacillus danicus]GEN34408.1 ammonium transporter [Aneurinibacillus danicus]
MKMWYLSILVLLCLFPQTAWAAGEVEQVAKSADFLWIVVSAILVIFMQPGFALLEAGSTRMKNAGHVAGKTVFTFGLSTLVFWAIGYGIAFGEGNPLVGLTGFLLQGFNDVAGIPVSIHFFFQFAFAGVSLAIACGGFAERAKLSVYLIFGILFTAIIYPVIGHWVWGGGWLAEHGKQDFAGSTVVHLTGATAALVATMLLKPRLGKFTADGKANFLPGHNQVYTVLGVFVLWVGWFGFNAGSTLSVNSDLFGHVAMTTQLATAAAAVFAFLASWMYNGKADITAMLNGTLAGLVAITASCAFVEAWAAVVIGAIAGVLAYFMSIYVERKGIDDPIYAVSVHGIAGVWGTLSTGFFAAPRLVEIVGVGKEGLFYGGGLHQLGVQAIGVLACFAYVAVVSYIVIAILKATIGIRVSEEEEILGLDLSEHGAYGYPEHLSDDASPSKRFQTESFIQKSV